MQTGSTWFSLIPRRSKFDHKLVERSKYLISLRLFQNSRDAEIIFLISYFTSISLRAVVVLSEQSSDRINIGMLMRVHEYSGRLPEVED